MKSKYGKDRSRSANQSRERKKGENLRQTKREGTVATMRCDRGLKGSEGRMKSAETNPKWFEFTELPKGCATNFEKRTDVAGNLNPWNSLEPS
jgi:hypothetical protein